MKKQYTLPKDFKFGSSASAWQTEGWGGKKPHQKHFVDVMYKADPGRWYEGIGTPVTTDFYHRYKEDIQLMKEMGIQVYRTSIDWSRFITNYETNEIDQEGLAFYSDVIDCLLENGIEPMLCLEHWEVPEYILNTYGSWENRKVMDLYLGYAKKVMESFHHKVKYWWSINEPVVVPEVCYMYGDLYPYEENAKKATQMNYHRALATSKLVEHFKEMKYDGKVGIILNPSPAYPKCKTNQEDVDAARICDLFNFRLYTDPLMAGEFSKEYIDLLDKHNIMFDIQQGDLETIRSNQIMMVGINYYQPLRVKQRTTTWNPKKPFLPTYYYETYAARGVRMNVSRGWEIYPKGIYDMLKIVQNEYGNIECWITENGMGVENEEKYKNETGEIQDDYRIDFISEHLSYVLKAMEEGSNCKGYLNWTFTDNLSPSNAFKNRYGFVEIDLNDNRNRRFKKSGHWVKELTNTKKFMAEDTEVEYK